MLLAAKSMVMVHHTLPTTVLKKGDKMKEKLTTEYNGETKIVPDTSILVAGILTNLIEKKEFQKV